MPTQTVHIVPVEQFIEKPYNRVLCYPKPDGNEVQNRIQQLRGHNVAAIEFRGKARAQGIPEPLLGKGFVGVVVIAHLSNGQRTALKILRVDADRPDLLHEAEMLAKANAADVGPKLIDASQNLLLTQLIEGDLLPAWLKAHREKAAVHDVLAHVLENCWRLDEIGLDHGELSKAPKHVIIDGAQTPFILDFETASDERKPANVTAICNFLFTSSGYMARGIAEVLGERNRERILDALHDYRKLRTRESFDQALDACLS